MTAVLPLPGGFPDLLVQYAPSAFRHEDTGQLTVDQAHQVMREHLDCLTEWCRVRRTAVRTLTAAGHLVPDSHRPGPLAAD